MAETQSATINIPCMPTSLRYAALPAAAFSSSGQEGLFDQTGMFLFDFLHGLEEAPHSRLPQLIELYPLSIRHGRASLEELPRPEP
jgi:hypothetical protein